MNIPLVSIIIPVFNGEKYLKECLYSALSQSWHNTEIIVIDDGSADQSLTIAQSFQNNKVKVISKSNNGASSARNTGIKTAQGSYIQFLDADDVISDDKIEKQVKALIGYPDHLAVCSTVHFNEDEDYHDLKPSPFEEEYISSSNEPATFLIRLLGGYNFRGSMIQPNAWLTPKSLIDKAGLWNESITIDDDGEFFSRIILNSRGIIKTEGLNFYRKFKTNTNLSKMVNENAYRSALNAVLLKKKHLLSKTSQPEAKAAVFYQLKTLQMACYPQHPSLVKEISNELKHFPGFKFSQSYSTPLARIVAKTLGWKALKQLQFLKNRQ